MEHRRLQEQQQHEEREGYEVAALFRREMLAKSGELVALQAEVALGAAALQAAAAAAAEREAKLQAGFEAERQQLVAAAAALQEELDGLAEFRQHKEGLQAELQRLRTEGARAAEKSANKVGTAQSAASELRMCGRAAQTGKQVSPTSHTHHLCPRGLCRCGRCSGGCTSWRAIQMERQLARRAAVRWMENCAWKQTCSASWHTTARPRMRCSSMGRCASGGACCTACGAWLRSGTRTATLPGWIAHYPAQDAVCGVHEAHKWSLPAGGGGAAAGDAGPGG